MGAIAWSFGLLVPALLLTQAAAQVQFTNSNYEGITTGTPFDITFTGDGSLVTIYLKHGPSTNLQTVDIVASDITASPYAWTPDTNLPTGTYALEITQDNMTNYSPMFPITGSFSTSSSALGTSSMSMSSSVDYATGDIPTTSYANGAIFPTTTYAMGLVVPTGYFSSYATGTAVPTGYNATGGYAIVPSGCNMTSGMPMGYPSSTGVVAMPSEMAAFEGAGSKMGVAQWLVCLMGAVVVVTR